MFASKRLSSIAALTVLAGTLAACGTTTTTTPVSSYPSSYPTTSYPTTSYPTTSSTSPAYVEYGRVTNIDMVTTTSNANRGTAGTLIGGVVGGLLGNTIGGGSGRAAATVLGAVGGAVVGNKVANANQPAEGSTSAYRIQVTLDNGTSRTYEVGGTGDLRVGDRVRIENNTLYRS